MDLDEFSDEYQSFLKKNFNKERSIQEKRYLYSDLLHYGVSVWERRKFIRGYVSNLKKLSKKEVLEFVKKFWAKPYFEERSLALEILDMHKNKLTLADMPLIEKLMRESRGWAFLDSLVIPIMPEILQKYNAYNYLENWIKDKDYWVRRSALLAQLELLRHSLGKWELFCKLAESQFDESWIDEVYKDKLQNKRAKFFIRKAIGWILRDVSRRQPEKVFEFLKRNKSKMSGLSYREGSRKLSEGLKNKL